MHRDLVGIIEAAYRIEQSEENWLRGILGTAKGTIDEGIGLVAFTYDASDPASFRFNSFVSDDLDPESGALLFQGVPAADADYVRGSFLSLACGTSSEVRGWSDQPFVDSAMYAFGIRDSLVINGMNPSGHGCVVAAALRREMRVPVQRRTVLSRISCHLAAAHRLRRRLAAAQGPHPAPEAIFDLTGKVVHAEGQASVADPLSRLKQSALAIARSTDDLRVSAPERAVEEWKGLIAARWTLLEVREADGRRYLVARQNQAKSDGSRALSEREQQIVALAGIGQHNKLIAYNLGISHATVRVLMARAAAKLGAKSRQDLIRLTTAKSAQPDSPEK